MMMASGAGNLSANVGLSTQRKQLKLSLDAGSESSFNNMTIKSADKHNSILRNMPLSTKNEVSKDLVN